MLEHQVAEKNRETTKTKVRSGQILVRSMDLEAEIQQAVAEATAAKPAPATWGNEPAQCASTTNIMARYTDPKEIGGPTCSTEHAY